MAPTCGTDIHSLEYKKVRFGSFDHLLPESTTVTTIHFDELEPPNKVREFRRRTAILPKEKQGRSILKSHRPLPEQLPLGMTVRRDVIRAKVPETTERDLTAAAPPNGSDAMDSLPPPSSSIPAHVYQSCPTRESSPRMESQISRREKMAKLMYWRKNEARARSLVEIREANGFKTVSALPASGPDAPLPSASDIQPIAESGHDAERDGIAACKTPDAELSSHKAKTQGGDADDVHHDDDDDDDDRTHIDSLSSDEENEADFADFVEDALEALGDQSALCTPPEAGSGRVLPLLRRFDLLKKDKVYKRPNRPAKRRGGTRSSSPRRPVAQEGEAVRAPRGRLQDRLDAARSARTKSLSEHRLGQRAAQAKKEEEREGADEQASLPHVEAQAARLSEEKAEKARAREWRGMFEKAERLEKLEAEDRQLIADLKAHMVRARDLTLQAKGKVLELKAR